VLSSTIPTTTISTSGAKKETVTTEQNPSGTVTQQTSSMSTESHKGLPVSTTSKAATAKPTGPLPPTLTSL